MFYLFSKTLFYLATPAGWLVALLCYAVFSKNRTHQRRAVVGSLILFCVLGNGFLINTCLNAWERPDSGLPTDSVAHVGVVLTGGIINVDHATQPARPLLSNQADRAGQALYLYRKHVIHTILISGATGALPFHERPLEDEAHQVAEFLKLAGVRPADILIDNQSRNTYENALFSARLLRQRFHTNHCVLITSAMHLRRAEACFQKQGILVSPFSANFIGTAERFSISDLLPHEEIFFHSFGLLREMIGFLTYKAMGYC